MVKQVSMQTSKESDHGTTLSHRHIVLVQFLGHVLISENNCTSWQVRFARKEVVVSWSRILFAVFWYVIPLVSLSPQTFQPAVFHAPFGLEQGWEGYNPGTKSNWY